MIVDRGDGYHHGMKIGEDGELGYDVYHQMARPGHGGHHGYQDVAWG